MVQFDQSIYRVSEEVGQFEVCLTAVNLNSRQLSINVNVQGKHI